MVDIFVDANIFLDVMRSRAGWQASSEVLDRVNKMEVSGFISSLTLTTLFYEVKKTLPTETAIQRVREALEGFQISDLGRGDLEVILSDDRIRDFEDRVQFHSAKKVTKVIVTRNKVDYRKVTNEAEVITPEEFLEKYAHDRP